MQDDVKTFLRSFKYIEEQCLKLDEQLSNVLKNVDVSALFSEMTELTTSQSRVSKRSESQTSVSNAPQQLSLAQIVKKVKQLEEAQIKKREETEKFTNTFAKLNDDQVLENFRTMGIVNEKGKESPMTHDLD